MDTKFQTSFIPKRSVVAGGSSPTALKGPINFISIIATIIFVLALVAAGGVYGYQWYLNGQITAMGEELEAARLSFDNKLFDEFIRLDARISSAKTLLNQHVAPSLLFEALQNMTVKNVQFKDFDYRTSDPGGPITISMRGTAGSFNALALQSEVLTKNKYVTNALFSDVTLDDNGNVVFNVQVQVNRELVAYKNIDDSLSLMYELSSNTNH
jgi:hypothetical protein